MKDEMMFLGQRPCRINTNTQNINTHIIKLWDDIGPPCDYQEEIDLIDSASEHDVIVLDICTDGGILDTAALFNRALRSTAGDKTQSPLKGENGLAVLEKVLETHPHEDATIVRFTPKDNCRSGIAGHLANVFEQQGTW